MQETRIPSCLISITPEGKQIFMPYNFYYWLIHDWMSEQRKEKRMKYKQIDKHNFKD